jgi:multisubunit Na+/H+ antiporter MnhB subunit
MNKKQLQKLSLICLIIGVVVMLLTFYCFHFVTDDGFTLTYHEEAGKPFVTDMLGFFGVLFIFASAMSFIVSLVKYASEKDK